MTSTRHHAAILDQFSRQAEPFAALPAHSDQAAMDLALSLARLRVDDRVLDVACGPGILACAMAPGVAHVTGIDLTPAMIAQAHRRQEELGLGNVDWQVGDCLALPYPDHAFTLVTCRYAVHHMPDPAATLAEMRRVCVPGGRLMVIDATPDADKGTAYDAMERLRDPSHVRAVPVAELEAIGRCLGLTVLARQHYRLAVTLEHQLRASAATAEDEASLRAMLRRDADSGDNRLGVNAHPVGDDIGLSYPISILVFGRD